MVKTECLALQPGQTIPFGKNPFEELDVGAPQILNEGQHANVLQQAGKKRLVPRQSPDSLAEFPGAGRFQSGLPPVACEDMGLDVTE